MKKRILIILLFMQSSLLVLAQESLVKVAEKFYNGLSYTRAIEYYEKALTKTLPPDVTKTAKVNLADSYYKVKDYVNAERVLKGIVTNITTPADPELILRYAQILASNGKYKEAQTYYQAYEKNMPTTPSSSPNTTKKFVALYEDVSVLAKNVNCYDVKYLTINTTSSDFSPAFYKDGLVFVSNRQVGTAVRRVFAWNDTPFLDLYHLDNVSTLGDGQVASLGSGETTLKPTKPSVGFVGSDQYVSNSPNDSKTLGVFGSGNIGTSGSYGTKSETDVDPFASNLNSKYHEGPAAFFKDGSQVIFTRNNFLNGKARKSSDSINKLKVYSAKAKGSGWSEIQELPFNSDEYSVGHPTLSPDDTYLVFASDMPGGFGGTDLYASKYDGTSWSAPINLGKEINTSGNELFPYLDPNGDLYFSSTGHPGLGGLDLFYVKMNEFTPRSSVSNLGKPINSEKDDFGLITDASRKKGYFSSNRKRGGDDDDIYSFDRTCELKEGCSFVLSVYDADTKLPIANASVSYRNVKGELIQAKTKADGSLTVQDFPQAETVSIIASAVGYTDKTISTPTTDCELQVNRIEIPLVNEKSSTNQLGGRDTNLNTKKCIVSGQILTQTGGKPVKNAALIITNLCDGSVISGNTDEQGLYSFEAIEGCSYTIETKVANMASRTIELNKVDCNILRPGAGNIEVFEQGDIITIENLYFDYGKYALKPAGIAELDKLVNIMRRYPDMKVELSSHTDSRSSTEFNQTLSDNRALTSANYLFKRGISRARVEYKGYGETKPVNGCSDGVNCSEEEHAKNRRTEIYILGINK